MIARSFRFANAPVVAGVLSYAPWIALLGVLSYLSWFITDDAFIAFRYVRNFVEGHGLVFNPGEHVEGYSSFLWVLELAAIWKIFGLPPEDVAQWLSVGYTAGVIALLLWWVHRDATLLNCGLAGWMVLGLVCGSATFAVWTSGGGLARQFTFFVMAAFGSSSGFAAPERSHSFCVGHRPYNTIYVMLTLASLDYRAATHADR